MQIEKSIAVSSENKEGAFVNIDENLLLQSPSRTGRSSATHKY